MKIDVKNHIAIDVRVLADMVEDQFDELICNQREDVIESFSNKRVSKELGSDDLSARGAYLASFAEKFTLEIESRLKEIVKQGELN